MNPMKSSGRLSIKTASITCALAGISLILAASGRAQSAAEPGAGRQIELVAVPADSPLVSIRVMVSAGSIYDPPGKEGLSALTALMLGASGTARRSYAELVEAFYPMAAGIGVQTGREVTVFTAQVHREVLADFARLFVEALVEPGFRADDFARHREQLLAHLTTTLRSANDELLGLELIQQAIFRDHPYGHAPAGTVAGLNAITLADVRRFYGERYTSSAVILGVAGGYPESFPADLHRHLAALPPGSGRLVELPAPASPAGRRFTLIDKPAEATGIHFGYPLPIDRTHPDFYPLLVANSVLGEHRTFHGRLMQELRGKRGLNYGDYSYLEYWDNPPGTSNPRPNHPRRQQYFSVWVRPVVPANAHFALRAAIYEVDRLIREGISEAEFDLARDFLVGYSKLWARSLGDRLGFHLDSRFLGMPYFIDEIERRMKPMTVGDVNRAIRKYLQTDRFVAVVITDDAASLRKRLLEDRPTPIEYEQTVAADVLAADERIAVLPLRATEVRIVPIDETFVAPRPRP